MGKLRYNPRLPRHRETFKAYMILAAAHWASTSFLDYFEGLREDRQAKGMSEEEEQDQLRAMFIFAASGLDSMVKQLARDALPSVIDHDKGA